MINFLYDVSKVYLPIEPLQFIVKPGLVTDIHTSDSLFAKIEKSSNLFETQKKRQNKMLRK